MSKKSPNINIDIFQIAVLVMFVVLLSFLLHYFDIDLFPNYIMK